MNVELRPITLADYLAFFKHYPARTIRGYAFMLDGEIVAVFGALLHKDATMLFSNVKDNLNVSPIIVWRWAKRALDLISDMKQPLFATTTHAGRFLESLGFVYRGDTKDAKLYEYLR